jgi:hypothetical protein
MYTQRQFTTDKANLTRAIRSGDPDKVVEACTVAVRNWQGSAWPDDWSRWQRALDDALGWPNTLTLDDLA